MKQILLVLLMIGSMSVFAKDNRVTCSCGNPPKTVVCLQISNASMSQCDHCCRRFEVKGKDFKRSGGKLIEELKKGSSRKARFSKKRKK